MSGESDFANEESGGWEDDSSRFCGYRHGLHRLLIAFMTTLSIMKIHCIVTISDHQHHRSVLPRTFMKPMAIRIWNGWLSMSYAMLAEHNQRRYWAASMNGLHLMLGYSNLVHIHLLIVRGIYGAG